MPSGLPAPDYWRESGVRHCVYCLCRQRPVPVSGQRQCSARRGLPSIVIRVSGIENCQPGFSRVICAVRLSTDSVCVCFAQPAGTALFQPDVTAGYIAFVDRHPAFKGELCRFQRNIVLHPFTEPRLQVDVIRPSQTRPLLNNPSSSRKSMRTCITPCCPVRLERLTVPSARCRRDRSAVSCGIASSAR